MAETTVLRSSSINRTPNAGAKPQAQLSGVHPVVQVNMNSGGPAVQNGQGMVRQGVTLLPPKGARRQFTTGGLPNQPAKQSVVITAPKDPRFAAAAGFASTTSPSQLTADQLLLCRHLTDKYLADLRTASGEAQLDEAASNNVQLAEGTITSIDAAMAAITAAAAEAVAPPPPPRVVAAGPRASQAAGAAMPRRVSRPAPPPVIVRMDGGAPIPDEAPPTVVESDAQG